MAKVKDFEAITIKLASPEEILSWSHGEVLKPETINYRTQRPEKDGLFAENIFGPTKDYECYCGKYKRVRYKGVICDKCGVEVTSSAVRRERMGHIKLAFPVTHISFLRSIPSPLSLLLDKPIHQIEKVVYFMAYMIVKIEEKEKNERLEKLEKEFKEKMKKAKTPQEKQAIREIRRQVREEIGSIKKGKILSEEEYRRYSLKYGELFQVSTGAEGIRRILEAMHLRKLEQKLQQKYIKSSGEEKKRISQRLKIIRNFIHAGVRPEWMCPAVLPVLPPDLRPMVQLEGGRYASSDLNDLYRRVINRNNRIRFLKKIGAPEVIVRNEKRMLQEAVDALIDNSARRTRSTHIIGGQKRELKSLCDIFKGKKGRFRQNLLGKRVDYSGRSVIVVNPYLRFDEVAIPKRGALELYRPFIIRKILERNLAHNVRGAGLLISEGKEETWEILEEVVKNTYVLLNRAPTLHRLSIQAFKPILVEGEAIHIHPLVCPAFNADFDGDQMAVFLPLCDEAQREARELMISNKGIIKPATGLPIGIPRQEMILGCYWLTLLKEPKGKVKVLSSPEEAKIAFEAQKIGLQEKIKVRLENSKILETTIGRIIFNEALPSDFPFQNFLQNSETITHLVSQLIERYDQKTVCEALDRIKTLGFEYATLSANTWGMEDLPAPLEKRESIEAAERKVDEIKKKYLGGFLSEEEKKEAIIKIWQDVREEISKMIRKKISEGPIFYIIDSGARGSWSQIIQMSGMKGLVINPAGEVIELPVKRSYKEGLTSLEYFISTHGARKGTVDTALRTSTAGYLTRRMVDVAHELIIKKEDCQDKSGFLIKRSDSHITGQSFEERIYGGISLQDVRINEKLIVKKGELIEREKSLLIAKTKTHEMRVRTPMTCKDPESICQKCYGMDLTTRKLVEFGTAVGIVAAQSIGEPGTQLTMRTFHTGGVVGVGDITLGLPRVEELFETRSPKGETILFEERGKVKEIVLEKKGATIKVEIKSKKSKKKEGEEYHIPVKEGILVKKGQEVLPGQPIFEGRIDVKKLFKFAGKEAAMRYLLNEIQAIYRGEGVKIHDKHIETMIRQMFSRVKVIDIGDSHFSPGEIVTRFNFEKEKEKLKKIGKNPAKTEEIILGITRVALSTDSFLSATSFQETTRVLVRAAIEGKVDFLRGLKENVIIGKLIPAGEGFKQKETN